MIPSDMIGRTVHHISLGEGEITDISEKGLLTVCFTGKEARFAFPDCFEKYISTDDAELKEFAEYMILLQDVPNGQAAKPSVSAAPKKMNRNRGAIRHNPPSLKAPKGGWYRYYEEHYPDHVIMQQERFMYVAHRESAEVMGSVMNYKVHHRLEDGEAFTGGPYLNIIAAEFLEKNVSYIAVNGGQIEDQYDGINPFKK